MDCLESTLFSIRDVHDVGVWDKGCWGSGMFRIKDGGWGMFSRIMDVDLERNRGH